jgi:phosphatidylserine/phosphatidylglycerophosphate/cardiolipin synthase-like enzyme
MKIILIIVSLFVIVSLFYFWNTNSNLGFTEVKTHQNNSSNIKSNAAGNNTYNPINHPIITEVYYDTYLSYDPDEYIRLYNPLQNPIDISNWQITDLENITIIPNNTFLDSNTSIYIARNGTAFYEENLFLPDFEMLDSNASIKNMSESQLQLSNIADEVILKDSNGTIVDVVAYGNSAYAGIGWSSAPVKGVTKGTILRRNIDEGNIGEQNLMYVDTNTSADWEGGRVFKIRQSNFPYRTFTYTGNLTVFVSPDSSFEALASEIDSATTTIYIEAYEITSLEITERLINATKRGVNVKILLEGNPVSWNMTNVDIKDYNANAFGEAYTQKYLLNKLHNAGAETRFMITDKNSEIYDRYSYLHGKYIMFDSKRTLITSENLKSSSFPVNGEFGNRGWGVVTDNENITNYLTDVFLDDWNITKKDIRVFDQNDSRWGAPPAYFYPTFSTHSKYSPRFKSETYSGTFNISVVLSPESSLLSSSIINLIKSTNKTIYVEQLRCKQNWTSNSNILENKYLQEVLDTAKRGCDVKMLFDSRYVYEYDDEEEDNSETVNYINNFSETNNLGNLRANLAHLDTLSKIHTKGMIVDGRRTLVSSINWNRGSVMDNREVGVIIESDDVANYFTRVFMYDWNLTLKNFFDVFVINKENIISPGKQVEIHIQIKNMDTKERIINLTVMGVPSNWSISPNIVTTPLEPNSSIIKSIIVGAPSNASVGDRIEFRIYGSSDDAVTEFGCFSITVYNESGKSPELISSTIILTSSFVLTISICAVIAISGYRDKIKGRR